MQPQGQQTSVNRPQIVNQAPTQAFKGHVQVPLTIGPELSLHGVQQANITRIVSQLSVASEASHRSARKKMKRRVAPVVGTSHSNRFSGAPEPSRDLFVYCVAQGNSIDDINSYII
jgi:hypothetical protein